MASISMITLMTTIILIATIVTIIFAVTVYIISRRKRRKNMDEQSGSTTISIIKTDTVSGTAAPFGSLPVKKAILPNRPKILKLYNPFKEDEEQKNGSEKGR